MRVPTAKELLDKEVTRKEFLKYGAMILLSLFGLHNIINLLSGNSHSLSGSNREATHGFGSRKFGD